MNDTRRESTRPSIGQRFRATLATVSMSFRVVRRLLACVLFVAATLKAFFPVTESIAPSFAVALILFELFLAVWLISGLLPQLSWCVASLCFAVFATISVMKIAAGETDCGCFGVIRLSPWFALSIDAVAVLLLLSSSAVVRESATSHFSAEAVCTGAFSFAALAVLVIGGAGRDNSMAEAEFPGLSAKGRYLIAEPLLWTGNRFPLMSRLDIGPELELGDWYVLLVRPDCEKCESLVRAISKGQIPEGKDSLEELALVSIERLVGGRRDATHSLGGVRAGMYTASAKLLMQTPLGVRLRDGIVLEVVDPFQRRL